MEYTQYYPGYQVGSAKLAFDLPGQAPAAGANIHAQTFAELLP